MKALGSILSVLLLFSAVLAQDVDPFADQPGAEPFDAFAEAEKAAEKAATANEPRITVLSEFIELPLSDWSELSRSELYINNDNALRKAVGTMMKSGEADLIDMSLVTGVEGERILNESFRILIYPTEFGAPQIDEKNGRILPASFDALECWDTGYRLSARLDLVQEGTIYLSISPEIQNKTGETEMGKGNGKVAQPEISIEQIYSDLELDSGDFALAGVIRATEPIRPEVGEAVRLVFVRATVHTPTQ